MLSTLRSQRGVAIWPLLCTSWQKVLYIKLSIGIVQRQLRLKTDQGHKVMKDSSLFANIFGRAREKMPTRVGVCKILSFWRTTYHDFVFQLCARPMVKQLKQVRSVFVSKKLVGQNGFSGEICGTLSCKLACVQTK